MKPENVAQEILAQIQTTIVLNMRFMDMAVFRLKTVQKDVSLATDGNRLYYNPIWLVLQYKKESNAATRKYLHVLLHCIFRHPFVHSLIDHSLWNLACDIAVEKMIYDFNCKHFSTTDDIRKQTVITELNSRVHPLTAEKLYNYFQSHQPDKRWADLFYSDNHEIWYNRNKAQQLAKPTAHNAHENQSFDTINSESLSDSKNQTSNKPEENKSQNRGQESNNSQDDNLHAANESSNNPKDNNQQNNSAIDGNSGVNNQQSSNQQAENIVGKQKQENNIQSDLNYDESSEMIQSPASLENEWRNISEHIQMDLESFGKQRGESAGSLQQMLAQINREKYDYESFLKKFSVLGEAMKINDDEFDYVFYTYGLKLFGNMPLIEPLEYKEVKRIREFVIAIDTSGSTSGKLVQTFLNKTWNILQSTESFFSTVNIHIIQCDAKIQEAVKVTKKEEFEEYIQKMTIRGHGGTDFRPVFTYVDHLIRQKEFRNLKGLIYFTDGNGTFPEKMPSYQTAFVFIQEEFNNINVPPWAIKLILSKDEI